MNYQPETDTYPDGINEIETTTQALGGVGGPINAPFLQLACRTNYLKAAIAALAPLLSPNFTGTPTAPTPVRTDDSTKIATTAFVSSALAALAPLLSPNFTGTPTAPTPVRTDDSTKIATTEWVRWIIGTKSSGLSFHYDDPGYIAFPYALGGFIVQWGTVTLSESNPCVVNFPFAFPNACLCGFATDSGGGTICYGLAPIGPTTCNVFFNIWASPSRPRILVLGY